MKIFEVFQSRLLQSAIEAVIKLLHHGLTAMTGRGLDFFIPDPAHWLTLDTLDSVQLPPASQRPMLRAAARLHSEQPYPPPPPPPPQFKPNGASGYIIGSVPNVSAVTALSRVLLAQDHGR